MNIPPAMTTPQLLRFSAGILLAMFSIYAIGIGLAMMFATYPTSRQLGDATIEGIALFFMGLACLLGGLSLIVPVVFRKVK